MDHRILEAQVLRPSMVGALAFLGALAISPSVLATSADLSSWRSTYPNSTSADNLASECTLCHTDKFSEFNGYGWDYRTNGRSFSAIESLNSDGDPSGASNLDEINANTQPGWTDGPNNAINGGEVSTNASPAAISAGTYDPAATNQPPVADIGGPYSGTQNVAVEFDASNSSDADGSIASYGWDFGDGSSDSGAKVSHAYAETGTYEVTLIVTDDAGDSVTATTEVTIGTGNQPPTADAKGPYSGIAGEAIEFDGSASSDADGSIVSYDWNFGDGEVGTGEKPTHIYAEKGTYNVTLTVTDDGDAMDSAVTSVSVDAANQPPDSGNQPPVANPAGPYVAGEGEELVFDGTGSSDPDGDIASYAWDFGDSTTGSGANPTHTYATAGTYNVSLTVTDDGGLTASAMTTATIGALNNQAPVAVANGPYAGSVNMALNFSSEGSEDPDGSIVAYAWDFGDGGTSTEANPSYTYSNEGTYNVTLTVTDNDGIMGTAATTAVIGVGNLPPTADAKGPYSAKVNEMVQFDGGNSKDPDGSIVSYEWDFGDGSTGSTESPLHGYADAGTYNVTLTVYDDSGAMDADVTTVTVTADTSGGDGGSDNVGSATIDKIADWDTGFLAWGMVVNDSDGKIGSWAITFEADFDIDFIWNARIVSHTGKTYVVEASGWDGSIEPAGKAVFGFLGSPADSPMPTNITVSDATPPGSCDDGSISTEVSMQEINDWDKAFSGLAIIRNTGSKEINGWRLDFESDFEITKIWNARIVSRIGNSYVLASEMGSQVIAPDKQVSFGFIATPGGSVLPTQFTLYARGCPIPEPGPIPVEPEPIPEEPTPEPATSAY